MALQIRSMVSCYDCEHFGTKCSGIVPPIEFGDRIDEYCANFKVIGWREQLYKPAGKSRV